MVKISIDYQGELRCKAVHEPSKSVLPTDAPKDNMGKGEAFSPTDLTATSLLTCMLTTMGIVAKKENFEFKNASGEILKEMTPAPDRRIGKLTVTIEMPKGLPKEKRALLEKTALTCPVYKSLNPSIEIPVKFNYTD